jgi:hypothetical protein
MSRCLVVLFYRSPNTPPFTPRQVPRGTTARLQSNCKNFVTECYSLVYTSSLVCATSSFQTVRRLSDHLRQDRYPQRPKPSWSAHGEVNHLMKGMKSHMNHPHRSDRNWQWFARTGFVASVPAHQGRTERKGLRKDWIGAFLAVFGSFATIGVMAGCNTGGHASSISQTPLISVEIMQAPPTMIAGNSAVVSATVTNDPAGAGVDWVVTCASPSKCGTFTPSHTASGDPAIYTAPPGIPSKNTVAVTALSTTDRSKSSSVSVSITSTVTGIAITTPLPGTVPAGAALTFGATVYGDPGNLGTDWTVTCPTPEGPVVCFSGLHSNAGDTVPFLVPQSFTDPVTGLPVSLVGATIIITAYATADQSKYAIYGPLPVTPLIAISITEAPPATMLTGATAPVIAVVSNDTSNAGVAWLVQCSLSSGPCGSVTPTQTASGVAATYTAPATVPSPNPAPGLTVTIYAFANATGSTGNASTLHTTTTVNIVAPISVSITQGVKNNTIVANHTASLVATVSNDEANAGVDWTVSCGSSGACGSFSPAHTASGATTTYTAPSAPPSGNTVTIAATSTADPTKSDQQQNVTVTGARPPNSLLQGQFVLRLSARNSKNGAFVLGGLLSGDGNGNVSGQFDVADAVGNAAASSSFRTDSASPSTYSIGPDGRGQITLILDTGTAGLTNFGVPVPSTSTSTIAVSIVFETPQHALLTEVDSFGDATGTLDLQNAADLASFAGLNGIYSLQLTGSQFAGGSGFFVAAAITSQFSNFQTTFTGYTADQSANGAITSVPFTVGSQTFFSFFSHQTGELSLNSVNLGLPRSLSLDLWMIDANHFVVTDFADGLSSYVLVGGYLTAQPASPSLSGTLAFTEAGATGAAQPLVAGGIFTCGSTGSLDAVPLGGTALSAQPVTAACSAPTNGRGSVTITGAGSAGISLFAAYPTVDNVLYFLELDGGSAGTSGPSGAGVAYDQTLSTPISASALSGTYASQFSATTTLGSQAFTGQVISDGVSVTSGTVDVNSFTTTAPAGASPSSNATLSGSYTAGSNGRFPLTFTFTPATGQPALQIPTLNPACYIVDANTCLLLGLDPSAPGVGILQQQHTGL